MKECLEPKQLRQKTDQSKTNQEFSYSNTWQRRLASVSPSGRRRKRRLPLLRRRGRHSHPPPCVPYDVFCVRFPAHFSVYVSPRTTPCTFPRTSLCSRERQPLQEAPFTARRGLWTGPPRHRNTPEVSQNKRYGYHNAPKDITHTRTQSRGCDSHPCV